MKIAALMHCLYELNNQGIYPDSLESLEQIIVIDKDWTQDLNETYVEANHLGLDTYDREKLFDKIALHFTNMNWPCYGDSKDYSENFYANIFKNIELAGWSYKQPINS